MRKNENYDKKGFYMVLYTLAAVFLLIAFGISILNTGNGNDEVDFDAPVAPVEKSNVETVSQVSTTADITIEATSQEITRRALENETTNSPEPKNNAQLTLFDESQEMCWPVSGKIVMDYSTNTSVYDKTLEQYRTNDSISISAPLGSDVVASSDGTVISISKDKINGVSVVLDHGNGWRTTYSQLQESLAVSEGQTITKGNKIGKIGKPTGYSINLGSHLDFTVLKDNATTDPKLVLADINE